MDIKQRLKLGINTRSLDEWTMAGAHALCRDTLERIETLETSLARVATAPYRYNPEPTRLERIVHSLIRGEIKMGWMSADEANEVCRGPGPIMREKLAKSLVQQAVLIETELRRAAGEDS